MVNMGVSRYFRIKKKATDYSLISFFKGLVDKMMTSFKKYCIIKTYNKNMFKNKKQKNKLVQNFLANQKFFVAFILIFAVTISALVVLYSSYQRLNLLALRCLDGQVIRPTPMVLSEEAIAMYKKLSAYDSFIRANMSVFVPKDSESVAIDGISFVGDNRALIFYHDKVKNLISEVVLKTKDDGSPEFAKVYLKNSNGNDYSQGVYGADPN